MCIFIEVQDKDGNVIVVLDKDCGNPNCPSSDAGR